MEPRKTDYALRIFLFFVAILLISSVIFLVFNLTKTKSAELSASPPPTSPSICIPPSSGEIFHTVFLSPSPTVPVGAIGDGYYYVKLKDHTSQKEVLSFFLHGKNTVNFNVDVGTYDLYFAHGDVWYGEDLLFGDDTEYMMAESPIVISQNNDPIQIWAPSIFQGEDLIISTTPIDAVRF